MKHKLKVNLVKTIVGIPFFAAMGGIYALSKKADERVEAHFEETEPNSTDSN